MNGWLVLVGGWLLVGVTMTFALDGSDLFVSCVFLCCCLWFLCGFFVVSLLFLCLFLCLFGYQVMRPIYLFLGDVPTVVGAYVGGTLAQGGSLSAADLAGFTVRKSERV